VTAQADLFADSFLFTLIVIIYSAPVCIVDTIDKPNLCFLKN